MPEQFGEKQHEATPHRRQQAREQGQVARSHDLASALLLVGAVMVLMLFGDGVVRFRGELARQQLGGQAWTSVNRDSFVSHTLAVSIQLGTVLLPVFGLLLLVAIAVHVGQVGLLFLPQKLALDASRINPLKGFRRLFSLSGAVRLGLGVVKVLVVAAVALWSLWSQRDTILALGNLDTLSIARFVIETTLWTCLKIGVALLLLAVIDYVYQRWKHEQDLRMTTQELREELKTLQGDPQIAARRRAVQRQLVMNRIGTAVPAADVVVTNPTELAIAIQYDHQAMEAPLVVAKGAGEAARQIRRLALEHDVPVVERKELARALYKQVEIGKPIPPEQYAAMAEVLRYVYQLKGKTLPDVPQAA